MADQLEAVLTSRSLVAVAWLGLVAILVASAAGKLYYKGSVGTALQKLGIASELLRKVLGTALAPAELLVAIWLASGLWPRWSTHAVLLLVLVFNVVLWRLSALGYDGGCGCFGGKSAGPVRVVHLIRNALMLVAAVLLMLTTQHHLGIAGPLWGLPAPLLLHAGLVLALLLVVYLLAGAAEKLLYRAYWR